jgi:DNA-directed RNA polymerase II subunit RPB3
VSFEYDPYNKLRHTKYWFETDERGEWPTSDNGKEEEPPRDDEPFDFNAKPNKFYFEVETDGSLGPQEVVMKVLHKLCRTSAILSLLQGLAELQTKLANLILGLKTQPEVDLLTNDAQTNSHATEVAWAGTGGGGSWANAGGSGGGWGGTATSPARGAAASTWGGSSPNGASSAWSRGAATGWASPSQQANGWNV